MTEHLIMPQVRRSDLEVLSGGAPILVLAPHPDDESLGCGGLLAAAFSASGAHVVCLTDGSASHPHSAQIPPARMADLRQAELRQAVTALGGTQTDVTCLGEPDTALPADGKEADAILDRLAACVRHVGAKSLFAPGWTDPHCDHLATAGLAVRVADSLGMRLFSYPIWARWAYPDFRLAFGGHVEHRFDTAPYRPQKAAAIACHKSQLGQVVEDDDEGYCLSPDLVAKFLEMDELFFERGRP